MLSKALRSTLSASAKHASVQRGFATRTWQHEKDLPRLPVPEVKPTIERYLRTLEPLLSESEFAKAKGAAHSFETSEVSQKLQQLLLERAATDLNWLEKWWDEMYLTIRDSNVNINYSLTAKEIIDHSSGVASDDVQTWIASQMLYGSVQLRNQLALEQYPIAMERGNPVSTGQLARLFGHARVPQPKRDDLFSYHPLVESLQCIPHFATTYVTDPVTRHVAVLIEDQFYKVDVQDKDGNLYPVHALRQAIQHILNEHRERREGVCTGGVAAFTGLEREAAHSLMKEIRGPATNAKHLDTVHSAMFVMVLEADDCHPSSQSLTDAVVRGQAGRRWYDKHQLVVRRDGSAGWNLEHAPGDGLTGLEWVNWARKSALSALAAEQHLYSKVDVSPDAEKLVTPLVWDIHDRLKASIEDGVAQHQEVLDKLVLEELLFNDFGSDQLRDVKYSPDAYAQMAMQLAYYRTHGRLTATYESSTTRGYLNGRTETVRSTSVEALAFCKTMCDPSTTVEQRDEALRTAIKAHNAYMIACKNGNGVDRHLYGLKTLAIENQIELPEIFTDPSYGQSADWKMSTSHLGSADSRTFGFAPVSSEGYGLGYKIDADGMAFTVSTFCNESGDRSEAATRANQFRGAISQALTDTMALAQRDAQQK